MKLGYKKTPLDKIEYVNEYGVKIIYTFEKTVHTVDGCEVKRTEEYRASEQIGDSCKMLRFDYKQYKRAIEQWNKIKEIVKHKTS